MTKNQEYARKFLEAYELAINDTGYRFDDALKTRSIVERATGYPVPLCWTGKYVGIHRKTGKRMRQDVPDGLMNVRKEYAIDIARGRGRNKVYGLTIAQLIDIETDYIEQLKKTRWIRQSIEQTIDCVIERPKREILKRRHLLFESYEQIARALNYSEGHVKRLYYYGLEDLGRYLRRIRQTQENM